MKAPRWVYVGLINVCLAVMNNANAGEEPGPAQANRPSGTTVKYEVALINKSMTGDWKDERRFKQQVKEMYGVSKVLRFRPRGDPLHDWLEEEEPSVAKIICLVDGWVDPAMARVDVRGFREGEPLKLTVQVEEGDWKAALTRAKQYVEGGDAR